MTIHDEMIMKTLTEEYMGTNPVLVKVLNELAEAIVAFESTSLYETALEIFDMDYSSDPQYFEEDFDKMMETMSEIELIRYYLEFYKFKYEKPVKSLK